MKVVTFAGTLTQGSFTRTDGTKVPFVPCRGFRYDYGEVYAQFEVCGKLHILLSTVPRVSP